MLARCLKPGGRIVVQTIDMTEDKFDSYRRGTDFIQQYIFPGGMLPSPSRFRKECEAAGLRALEVLSFGQDYAETLKRWSQRFEASLSQIRELGYDDAFIRIWKCILLIVKLVSDKPERMSNNGHYAQTLDGALACLGTDQSSGGITDCP